MNLDLLYASLAATAVKGQVVVEPDWVWEMREREIASARKEIARLEGENARLLAEIKSFKAENTAGLAALREGR